MGFPTLNKLTETFKGNDQVVFVAIQTVFEGHTFNTEDKLRANQLKYDLKIPMAHVAGDATNRGVPDIMIHYRSGGTPWKVIIDPTGKVVYNAFHIKFDQAVALINRMISKQY